VSAVVYTTETFVEWWTENNEVDGTEDEYDEGPGIDEYAVVKVRKLRGQSTLTWDDSSPNRLQGHSESLTSYMPKETYYEFECEA
jgi:hypothetical protein